MDTASNQTASSRLESVTVALEDHRPQPNQEHLALAAVAPPETADAATRTVTVVAYSGEAVQRLDPWTGELYQLRLGLEDGQVRLGRMVGAPVLDSHANFSIRDQIGVVERAWVQSGQLLARLRFSERDDVEPIWRDILAGIVRNVSIGALIYKRSKQPDGTWLADDWEPMEISMVPVPADAKATVLSHFTRADARSQPKEVDMQETIHAGQKEARETVDMAALRAQIAEEHVKIRKAVRAAGLEESFGEELCQRAASLDEARAAIFEELAARYERTPTRSQVAQITHDAVDKRIDAMTACLMRQINPSKYEDDPGNEWRGMRLSRMAEECVRLAGMRRPTSPHEMVRLALSTSDFPNVLANVANQTLLDAYQYASPSYRRWCRQSTAPDFKTIYRVRIGEFPSFEQLAEGGAIRFGSVAESKEQYAIATYARGVVITREMIINDDLGAINQLFAGIGVQAAVLENRTVYAIVTTNPTMSDGVALFHATHGNLAGSGSTIGVDAVGAGRAAMMAQKGLDGATPLNIAPRFLIVPAALATKAEAFVTAGNVIYTKQADVNPFAGRLEVVSDAMLDTASTTAWYLAADPMLVPTIEYAYLEGAQGPQVERVENPDDTLGLKIKAWLDFGAKAIDWRGLYKNPGA
ncbi:MAG: hypothetical protein KatS3mg004_1854 [Bryobacteraceae bacterium]|nr:MAG: hypothetical protein KatS3mg004_1854 [Bryobacteraceae bacterium]